MMLLKLDRHLVPAPLPLLLHRWRTRVEAQGYYMEIVPVHRFVPDHTVRRSRLCPVGYEESSNCGSEERCQIWEREFLEESGGYGCGAG